jgi:hypothetical protein
MNKLLVVISLLIVAALACGTAGAVSEPKAAVAPITLAADLTAIDLCQAMPRENIEAVLGRALVETPERFEFYDASGTSGCAYSAGKGSDGAAYFGYIALTPAEVYENQPLYLDAEVSGFGQSAYFNNGADARQLWVKVNDDVAFVVAFGDEPREEGAKAIARLLLAAIR